MPQNPSERPDNYQPPTSAKELIERYNNGERYFEDVQLEEAMLVRARLEGANLLDAHLEMAVLREAHLEGTMLMGAHLEEATLGGVHLEGAYLEEAHLEEAYLSGAHLEGAYLSGTHLERAMLNEAHLEGADLRGANLENANISGMKISKRKAWQKPSDLFDGIMISNAGGDPVLKRYIMDQDYISSYTRENSIKAFFWRITCGYGQSFVMLLGWAFIIALIFGGVFWANMEGFDARVCPKKCHASETQMESPDCELCGSVLTPFYFSVVTLTTLGFGDVTPKTTCMQFAVMMEVVFGYLILGLLISILANKVARRS